MYLPNSTRRCDMLNPADCAIFTCCISNKRYYNGEILIQHVFSVGERAPGLYYRSLFKATCRATTRCETFDEFLTSIRSRCSLFFSSPPICKVDERLWLSLRLVSRECTVHWTIIYRLRSFSNVSVVYTQSASSSITVNPISAAPCKH